jgi:hypothetical protein
MFWKLGETPTIIPSRLDLSYSLIYLLISFKVLLNGSTPTMAIADSQQPGIWGLELPGLRIVGNFVRIQGPFLELILAAIETCGEIPSRSRDGLMPSFGVDLMQESLQYQEPKSKLSMRLGRNPEGQKLPCTHIPKAEKSQELTT